MRSKPWARVECFFTGNLGLGKDGWILRTWSCFLKINDTSLEGGPRHDRYKSGENLGPLQIDRKNFTGESGVSGSLPIRSYNLQHL